MKYCTTFLLILSLTLPSCASLKELPTDQVKVQKVFELPGLTQKQIFNYH